MKSIKDGLSFVFAISLIFSSCAKNEESIAKAPAAISGIYILPNLPTPKPGIEPSDPIPMPPADELPWRPHEPFTLIQNPTEAYIKETCLFDISKMELGSTYHQVNNKNINIAFFSNFVATTALRLTNTPSSPWAWLAQWNYAPYVEKEHPDVVFTYETPYLILALSKPCTEFGVEIAPDFHGQEHLYTAEFGNFVYDSSAGYADQLLKVPSGARLFAVKSTKPFSVVSIVFNLDGGSPDFAFLPDGYALANIRYKLAP